MLNVIWMLLLVVSVICAVINGKVPDLVNSVTDSAKFAFTIALGLTGIMAFWLGIMKIAEEAKLIELMARALRPVLRWLFPDVPSDHPAMGSMLLNITSNMLGLTNAATPFGLRAMAELDKLNLYPGTATNAMCTFLAINTSSIQIIPTTAIAYLAAAGDPQPTRIIVTALFGSVCATTAAVLMSKICAKLQIFRIPEMSNITESKE